MPAGTTGTGVTCHFGEAVTGIDRARKMVITETGETPHDKLDIATGSTPFMIPIPGHDLPGVVACRDLDDTNAMIAAAGSRDAKAVVIGGVLLGLEAAAGLQMRGMDVTVIHLPAHLLDRQLDEAASYLLRRELVSRGIKVRCAANSREIHGQGRVEGLRLGDGTELPADLIVMAVGIRRNSALALAAGLAIGRGIRIDDRCVTSDEDILAVGECVEQNGAVFGLVAPIIDMARVLARTLAGQQAVYAPIVTATRLKVTGIDLFSAGDFADGEGREDIVFRDSGRGLYKRLVIEDDRLVGAVISGDTADGNWFFARIKSGEPVADDRETLIFGPAFQGGEPLDPMTAVAALPADVEICGCNGASKGRIVAAIEGGATDLGAVRAVTKASGSCGTCSGLVEQVLAVTLGDDFALPVAQPVCDCTELSHEDVRRLIKSRALESQPAMWQEPGWETRDGCHVHRPAINHYLLADWPLTYVDDPQSRVINERRHANIQKDGTYSVMPRMWGGITNPAELRAIADAAEKFRVPTVKVTGGQRIDLLGVRQADLPAIWADLNAAGMVSGHACSEGLRTVKTCVGTDHCRFGTQDSTGLGIQLEKALWGSWSPHKVKLCVSGRPRNCAEATCMDVGVVCVEGGYQIGVGGAAGMDVKAVERLADVKTGAEVLEMVQALVPALPRDRQVSRPALQVDRQDGTRLGEGSGRPRCRQLQGAGRAVPWQPAGLPARAPGPTRWPGGPRSLSRSRISPGTRRRSAHPSSWRGYPGGSRRLQRGPQRHLPASQRSKPHDPLDRYRPARRHPRARRKAAQGCVAVFRTHDARIFALRNRCPHRGGPFSEGTVDGHRVTCPLHNHVIDLKTGAAQAAGRGQVETYPVRIDGGRVRLDGAAIAGRSAA